MLLPRIIISSRLASRRCFGIEFQNLLQDIFRIPLPFHLPVIGDQIVIHGFGLMLVIGFLCAMSLAKYLARKSGQDPEVFANAALLALFAGVLGARLSHVLENIDEFTDPKL